jgi:hypothetical protein
MPRTLVVAVLKSVPMAAIVGLVCVGVALAGSYKTGTYKAGSATKDGVNLRIGTGTFSLSRISFTETCSNASDSFTERFAFVKGSKAKLDGRIDSKGRLSGTYKGQGGTVTITGTVKGSAATVKGTESGTFTPPQSTASYTCRGSKTFTAKLSN